MVVAAAAAAAAAAVVAAAVPLAEGLNCILVLSIDCSIAQHDTAHHITAQHGTAFTHQYFCRSFCSDRLLPCRACCCYDGLFIANKLCSANVL